MKKYCFVVLLLSAPLFSLFCGRAYAKQLDLWQEPYRKQLIHFTKEVSTTSSPQYVSPQERVAVFDMDGTLITERPTYLEVQLALHFLKEKIRQNPKLLKNPLFQAVARNDSDYIEVHGKEIMSAYVQGKKWEELAREVREFYENDFNETFRCKHAALAYAPMVQLISYLPVTVP